ncbi:putative holin-like toxin [Paucilactobacillus hokkaidonensis]|nr:putative holin-like toxin [Paucilactobacillus hokkaidonensis]
MPCGINLKKGPVVVSVTDAILLMLDFGGLILMLISVIVAIVVAIIKR